MGHRVVLLPVIICVTALAHQFCVAEGALRSTGRHQCWVNTDVPLYARASCSKNQDACAAWVEPCSLKSQPGCTKGQDGVWYSTKLSCWESLDACRALYKDSLYRSIMLNLTCCSGQACNYPSIVQQGGGILQDQAAASVQLSLPLLVVMSLIAAGLLIAMR
mmetsp:Transcript_38282/g.85249  ORF Transcript_38282/g.85249 Transcript_38282/m.85249 type:complete len:162 (-) Transcript_38282:1355-1840(-)